MVFQIEDIAIPAEVLALFNPSQHYMGLPTKGIPTGKLLDGQPFVFNPWELKRQGLITGTSVCSLADKDQGKTTFGTSWVSRLSGLTAPETNRPYRVNVDDFRANAGVPEYDRFATFHGFPETDLSSIQLNPLDARMGQSIERMIEISTTMLAINGGIELSPSASSALSVGMWDMYNLAPDDTALGLLQELLYTQTLDRFEAYRRQTVPKVLGDIKDPIVRAKVSERINGSSIVDESTFRRDSAMVADGLKNLLDKGVFGGTTSVWEVLHQEIVALNYTNLTEMTTLLIEYLMYMWRLTAINSDNFDIAPNILLLDESWSRMRSLVFMRVLVELLKKIRGSGLLIWRMLHRLSDINNAGSVGSELVNLAMSSLNETDVWFIGKQQASELPLILNRFPQLDSELGNYIPQLQRGLWIVVIGQIDPFPVYFTPTQVELDMTPTNIASDRMAMRR